MSSEPTVAWWFASAASQLEDGLHGSDLIASAIYALRAILAAAEIVEGDAVPEGGIRLLDAKLHSASRPLAAASGVSLEEITLGMGAAGGVAALYVHPYAERANHCAAGMLLDYIDHTAMLAARLEMLLRGQRIDRRGDVLRRTVTILRAMDQGAVGAPLH